MDFQKLVLLALRAFLLLCAVVVLGLSAHLYSAIDDVKDQCSSVGVDCDLRGLLPALGLSAFTGAWGLLAGLVGLVAIFVAAIPWIAMLAIDGLAAIFFLAAGIVSHIAASSYFRQHLEALTFYVTQRAALWLDIDRFQTLDGTTFYTRLQADTAFMFLGLLTTFVVAGLTFFWRRSGKV